jgi:hypothetical protein
MPPVELIGGALIVLVVAWDAFATVILPRRVSRRLRLSGVFLEMTWRFWTAVGRRLSRIGRGEGYLGTYALLALLALFGLWSLTVLLGYSVIDMGLGSNAFRHPGVPGGFGTDLYVSGTTLFTLGLGDVLPATGWARVVTVIECATGLTFLALVISYLPVLYQSFSTRELEIAMLDEWAGTPPTAVELLRRLAREGSLEELTTVLRQWELWAAELLESHISYPILGYYRSQHDNESWLAGLTAVLDTATLSIVGLAGVPKAQARRTFAMARHAAVDLSQVLNASPTHPHEQPRESTTGPPSDRPSGPHDVEGRAGVTLSDLASLLEEAGVGVEVDSGKEGRFAKIRESYEPYLEALSVRLLMPLPPLLPGVGGHDNWRASPWEMIVDPTESPVRRDSQRPRRG